MPVGARVCQFRPSSSHSSRVGRFSKGLLMGGVGGRGSKFRVTQFSGGTNTGTRYRVPLLSSRYWNTQVPPPGGMCGYRRGDPGAWTTSGLLMRPPARAAAKLLSISRPIASMSITRGFRGREVGPEGGGCRVCRGGDTILIINTCRTMSSPGPSSDIESSSSSHPPPR